MHEIRHVEFHDDLYETLDRLNVPHYEEILYERLALGYWLATKPISKRFVVAVDDELKRLLGLASKYRKILRTGPELAQITKLLESGPMTLRELHDHMLIFGYNVEQLQQLLLRLQRLGIVRIEGGLVRLR